jgi:glycosyltransferase involved in cell wall biosynthesis
MVLSLLTVIGFLVLVLLMLTIRDLSPLRAFYKTVKRLTGVNLEPQPLPMTGPYSRPSGLNASQSTLHRPIVLNLETYEATGQNCHPDVVYIAEGFGAGRWPYWMATTPYPDARDRFENPSIYASYDGVNWVVPGCNPVVQPPPLKTDHLSDVDMIFTGGRLRLYYRESFYSRKPAEHFIHAIESDDGVTWTSPQCVLFSRQELLCSPSVIAHESGFLLWEVSSDTIWRRESPDGLTWGAPERAIATGLPTGQVPWHLDVYQQGPKLHVILNSRGVDGHRLHYGYSLDEGRSWKIHPYLIDRVYGFEWGQHYRATMIAHPQAEGLYQFWYSARSREQVWSIAYMHLIEHGDTMVPVEVMPSTAVPDRPAISGAAGTGLLEGEAGKEVPERDELVSVVIPAFNARSTIRETVESVQSQSYRNLEIIIVDDASTDGTSEAVADLAASDTRIRLIRRDSNGGLPSTRNVGIKASSGVYVSFVDADDLWHPDKIMRQVEKMRQCGPQVAVVYCWCTYMDATSHIIPRRVFAARFEGDIFTHLLISNFINNTLLVRRSCLDAVGYYREELVGGGEDLQLYLDLAARYDFAVVPEFLTAYRLLPSSKSHDVWKMRAGHMAVLARARDEHPSLPAWLFRWSEANQLWFLGFRCLRAGRWSEGLALLLATVWRDPSFILRPTVRQTLMRAITRKLSGNSDGKPAEGPRLRYLNGGPPPNLEVPLVRSRIEQWRSRRISGVSVRTVAPSASGQAAASGKSAHTSPMLTARPGLGHVNHG